MLPKNFPITCLAIALVGFAAAPDRLSADEPTPDGADARHPSTVRAVPIRHYWDANAWDPAGGSLFWHSMKEKRNSADREQAGRNTRHAEARDERSAARKPASGR